MASKKSNNTTALVDIYNKVTPEELEGVIRKNMETIMKDPDMSSLIPPIVIRSSPGMGKSSIVKKVAHDLGIGFIDQRLTQVESCDIRGLPVPNKENKTMDWYVNGTWPREKDSFGILFLDELLSCDKSIQCASYELILDRKLGELYRLPKGWMIVAAGNLVTDRAVSQPMTSALANRFLHLQLDATAEDWMKWGRYNDIEPSVMGFIGYRPEMLHKMEDQNLDMGWPSPRSWERVSTMVKLYGNNGHEENVILRKLIYGLVGNGAGVEFMEFYKMNSQFDNVLEYMLNPDKEISIPDRADAKYALVSAMVYQLWRGRNEEDEKKRIDGFFRISMQLTPDFAAMAMVSAMAGTSKENKRSCCDKLFGHSGYKAWMSKYGKSFHKKYSFD